MVLMGLIGVLERAHLGLRQLCAARPTESSHYLQVGEPLGSKTDKEKNSWEVQKVGRGTGAMEGAEMAPMDMGWVHPGPD